MGVLCLCLVAASKDHSRSKLTLAHVAAGRHHFEENTSCTDKHMKLLYMYVYMCMYMYILLLVVFIEICFLCVLFVKMLYMGAFAA